MTRSIRGIRDSIVAGLLGRKSSGAGPAEVISWKDVGAAVAAVQRGRAATNSTGAILPANPVQEDFVPAGGTTGQVLTKASDSDFDADWETPSSGSGDVVGPASSTAGDFAQFDGTTGKLLKDTGFSFASFDAAGAAAAAQAAAEAASQPVDADLTAIAALSGTGILVRTAANTWALRTIQAGTNVTVTDGDGVSGDPSIAASGGSGSGTVTSVAMTVPGILSVSGSPITTSGTLALTLATQSANLVFASPSSGAAAAPTFRSLVAADLPASGVTAGTYGDATHVCQATFDAEGRCTSASNVAITGGGGSGSLIGTQIFTSGSGTYTPTTGTTSVVIEMVGGGGGAAGLASQSSGTAATGQSGGGGAYLLKRLTSNFNGGTYSVGSGGNGGAAGNNAGNNGGDTTFTDTASNVYTAGGGLLGSIAGTSATPRIGVSIAGGTATGGDVNVPGGASGVTMALSASALVGAYGGASRFSFGGLPNRQTANPGSTVGNDAGGFGGGGSVGLMIGSGTAVRGGNGSGGIIIIWEYSWETPSSGSGDVVGPASSTAGDFAQFDGTTGKLLKDTGFSFASFDAAGAAAAAQAAAEAASQPVDADLTAIAGLTGTGILVRTAANTWALRSIAAGTNVTVSNGDGVAGNPSIAASGGGSSGANVTPDTHPGTPNAADDEFESGSSIDTAGTRGTGATAWSWVNQGSATAVVTEGSLVLAAPAFTGGDSIRMVVQSTSGSTWKYRCKLSGIFQTTNSNFYWTGLLARNSTSGKLIEIKRSYSFGQKLEADVWTNFTTFSATRVTTDIFSATDFYRSSRHPIYLEIEQDATNLYLRYSDSGVEGTFYTFWTEALSTFLTSVDQIGLMTSNNNNSANSGIFDWFRKIA